MILMMTANLRTPLISSAKEVMFSFLSVSWFVCLQDCTKNTQLTFNAIRWKGGTRATEETISFWR